MRQHHFRKIVVLFFLTLSFSSYGQKAPEELGRAVFYCIKSHSAKCVDRYLPTQGEYTTIVKELYRQEAVESDKEISSDYISQVKWFKALQTQILSDSLQLKINWEKAKLKKVQTRHFTIPMDTTDLGQLNRMRITEVKIIFTVDKNDYVLFLPSVWKHTKTWKLGNQILYGKGDFKYGEELVF